MAGSIDFHNKACVYDFLCVRLSKFFLTQVYAKIESISFLDWPKAEQSVEPNESYCTQVNAN